MFVPVPLESPPLACRHTPVPWLVLYTHGLQSVTCAGGPRCSLLLPLDATHYVIPNNMNDVFVIGLYRRLLRDRCD